MRINKRQLAYQGTAISKHARETSAKQGQNHAQKYQIEAKLLHSIITKWNVQASAIKKLGKGNVTRTF